MRKINDDFAKKAAEHKRELLHTRVVPTDYVTIEQDETAFQKLRAVRAGKLDFPLTLNSGDEITVDFGNHCVGYLNFSLMHLEKHITDSPIQLQFSFGEFPLEITAKPEDYKGSLGSGWLQNETHTEPFTPCSVRLSRRYSFRYLRIKRTDSAKFAMQITELFVDAVSAVSLATVKKPALSNAQLAKIYDISLNTLKECEQDVFEDGPKRDRRLWIGDLRLQALTDYVSFRNIDLIKRCIYLFAAYPTESGHVAPCVFPDSPPYVDGWHFPDYSLFFVCCLNDYAAHTGDLELVRELFEVAEGQVELYFSEFGSADSAHKSSGFIDWCPGLNKQVAMLGAATYAFKHFRELCVRLERPTERIDAQLRELERAVMKFYSEEQGLFVTSDGQISYHSQVWSVLAGVLPKEDCAKALENVAKYPDAKKPHTPYMMHYYIDALYTCGMEGKALETLRDYWGKIADFGFDCCPEIFNPDDHFESPYKSPEINSACHAWSCTPVYWLTKMQLN